MEVEMDVCRYDISDNWGQVVIFVIVKKKSVEKIEQKATANLQMRFGNFTVGLLWRDLMASYEVRKTRTDLILSIER